MTDTSINFKVLLIGGGSASGKTELAKYLAEYFKLNRILADDVRIAMEAVVSKTSPIYNFDEDEQITQEERSKYPKATKEDASREVCKGLENIIHHHIIVNDPIIIEGDDILPEFAEERQKYDPKVRSIFLYNDDADVIKNNLISRKRMLDEAIINEMVVKILKQNLKIRDSAQQLNLNTLKSTPYETLFARVKDALE